MLRRELVTFKQIIFQTQHDAQKFAMNILKKILKKIVIAISVIIGLYLIILFILGIYINSKKENILVYIRTELGQQLRGNAQLGNLDVSMWKHFPSIAFEINDFSLKDSIYNKPIIAVKTLATTLNIFKLLSANKEVKNIIIENGIFHLFTDSNGYRNNYLLQLKKSKPPGELKENTGSSIDINKISIKELEVIIEDQRANKEISFVVNELNTSIDQEGQLMNIEMDEKITMKKGLGFNLRNGAFLEKQVLDGRWKLQMNKATKTLSFDKTNIGINGHPFELSGSFCFAGEQKFRINVSSKDLPFENAKAILSNNIRQKIAAVQMKQPITMNGIIDGTLLGGKGDPLLNFNWKTENNTLTTPVASFTECNFEGGYVNNVNKDSAYNDPNSRITFKTFTGNWDGVKLSGKDITITNLRQPQLHFDFKSNCSLEALDDKFALKDISFVNGTADLDLFYDGRVIADKSLLQDLEGKVSIKNGTILYVPRNFNFTNCNGDVAFYKDSIGIGHFSCSYLKNKFDVRIQGKNLRRKFVAGDISQEAMVKCYLSSSYINLEDFKPLFGEKKQRPKIKKPAESFSSVTAKLDNALSNSVIGINVKATDVKYQHLEAKNFEADIKFEPHYWKLAMVSLNLASGSIVTTGQIIHNNRGSHDALVTTKITNVDVKKLLYSFDNFGQDAITHQQLNGVFSADASIKAGISSTGKIIPASLFGNMNFSLKNGSLVNFPGLMNIKTFVFKNRDMSNVQFAELKDKIDIKGTEVYMNRMELQSSVLRLFVEGNYGLNGKNTDLLIQVPLSNLSDNSFEEEGTPKNKGTKAKAGTSVWLRAVNDDNGKIKMKITLNKKLKNKKKEDEDSKKP